MKLETSQAIQLGQQMKPRMIQLGMILAMPLHELEERVERELESNPTLERANDATLSAREARDARRDEAIDDRAERAPLDVGEGAGNFSRLDRFEADNPDLADQGSDRPRPGRGPAPDYEPRAPLPAGERDPKHDVFAAIPARAASLADQLLDQWRLADAPAELRALGELLIQFLDDDGYLRTSLAEVTDRAPPDRRPVLADLELALAALQEALEPPGVAARDRRECLLLQLDARLGAAPVRDLALEDARLLVDAHLVDLAQNRLSRIVERTDLTLERINAAKHAMRGLSLAPARSLVDDATAGIVPDAVVEYDERRDRYIVYPAATRLPILRLNRLYEEMAADRAVPKRDREFLRTNLSNARWLKGAIKLRRETLLRVVRKVVEHQRDYFDDGPRALKPLDMTQIAVEIGVHVSTVSRAVNGKHLQTPRGVVPLRRFFTSGLATEGGGEMSYDAAREAVREAIAAEDKTDPLSDDAVANALKAKGVVIVRRTVAKYRDQLGIPAARLRKSFAGGDDRVV